MGTSQGDFVEYPRTPHLFGSAETDDDKHLGEEESMAFIADESLIVANFSRTARWPKGVETTSKSAMRALKLIANFDRSCL